jgi:site-specific recombinase XerD
MKTRKKDHNNAVYESYLSSRLKKVSRQAYMTIKKNALIFIEWINRKNILLEEVTTKDCIRYRYYLSRKKKKDGAPLCIETIHNRLKAGKALFRYLVEQGECPGNPFEEIKYPRIPEHYSRNVLNEAQMGNLLNYIKYFDKEPTVRDRIRRYKFHVIAEFLYATGLRINEAASLVPENIDTDQRFVYVIDGKGSKSRVAFLTGYAADVLKVYLSYGREKTLGKYERLWGHTLFGSHPERLMSVVNQELRKCCLELGLPVISSHGFRHSLGTHLHRAGCNIRYIQAIMGHESIAATQVYTEVNKFELVKILDVYHSR